MSLCVFQVLNIGHLVTVCVFLKFILPKSLNFDKLMHAYFEYYSCETQFSVDQTKQSFGNTNLTVNKRISKILTKQY